MHAREHLLQCRIDGLAAARLPGDIYRYCSVLGTGVASRFQSSRCTSARQATSASRNRQTDAPTMECLRLSARPLAVGLWIASCTAA